MDGECSTHEREYIKIMIGQTEGNSLSGKPRYILERKGRGRVVGVTNGVLFFEQLHSMG